MSKFNLLAFNNEEAKQPTVYGFGVGFNSGFNKGRFNLIPFNISSGVGWIEVEGVETITSHIIHDIVIMFEFVMNEKIDLEIAEGSENQFVDASGIEEITQSVFRAVTFIAGTSGEEFVNSQVVGHQIQFLYVNFSENVTQTTNIVGVTYVSTTGSEEINHAVIRAVTFLKGVTGNEAITQQIGISDDVKLKATLSEIVSSSAVISQAVNFRDLRGSEIVDALGTISQNVKLDVEGLELVSVTANVDATEEKTCILTITMKPGQRLIIDANTYNVWLDGENVVYIQSGDWIDELNRNTLELAILAASGSNNLNARIVYQERYL